MDWMRALWSRLRALGGAWHTDGDLNDELAAHLELAEAENRARGMSPEDAHREALRVFGGLTQTREAYRMQRGFPLVEQLVRDLRYAARQLRRSPGFTLTAVLTLALGLGANIAVFSLINCILLRPLPVPRASQLAILASHRDDDTEGLFNHNYSAPLFRGLEQRHPGFASIAAFSTQLFQLRTGSGSVQVSGSLVSGQFFQTLETAPQLGRWLTPQDDREGAAAQVVISDGFWKSWFNRDPHILGRTLTIANTPFTIVGVMPAAFIGADPVQRPEVYLPLWAEPITSAPYSSIRSGYHAWWLQVLGRRAPGISLEQADSALAAATLPVVEAVIPDADWVRDARQHHMRFSADAGARGWNYLRTRFQKPLLAVFALCAAMLLLACLNLASLLMARAAFRERELATRLALGASRGRLVRQLLVESLLLALLGTGAGLAASPLISRVLVHLLTTQDRRTVLDTSLDLRVLAFVTLTGVISTLAVGLVPALRATSRDLNEQIKSGAQSIHCRQTRLLPRLLMGVQVALALVLIAGAGLLVTSLGRLYHVNLGYEPRGAVALDIEMDKQGRDGAALLQWYREYADGLRRIPGVSGAAYASFPPMSGATETWSLGSAYLHDDQQFYMNTISPGYFDTLRIQLKQGRDFSWSDTLASGRKMVLSERAARLLFPGRNAIGQTVKSDGKDSYIVVGIVSDIHYSSIRGDAPAEGYTSITQSEWHKPSYTAIVRLDGPVVPFADASRQLASRMAPEIPVPALRPLSADIDAELASERILAILAGFFALSALLVTAIGLYGTLAYATARRTSEIGVRIALGARRLQVVALVFRENVWIAFCGVLIGLAASLAALRTLASFLYTVSWHDPLVLAGSVAVLGAVASAASLAPAIHAARIDPMSALRAE